MTVSVDPESSRPRVRSEWKRGPGPRIQIGTSGRLTERDGRMTGRVGSGLCEKNRQNRANRPEGSAVFFWATAAGKYGKRSITITQNRKSPCPRWGPARIRRLLGPPCEFQLAVSAH